VRVTHVALGRAHSQVPLTHGRTTSTASGGRNQTCALGAGCPGECSGRGLCQQVRRLDDSDIALSPRPFLPPPRPGPLHGTPSHTVAHNNTNYRFLALVSVSLPASLRPPGALPVPVPRVGLGLRGHVEGQPVRPRVTHSLTSLPHRALSLPLPHLTRYAIPDTLPFLIHSLHTPFSARLSLSAGSLLSYQFVEYNLFDGGGDSWQSAELRISKIIIPNTAAAPSPSGGNAGSGAGETRETLVTTSMCGGFLQVGGLCLRVGEVRHAIWIGGCCRCPFLGPCLGSCLGDYPGPWLGPHSAPCLRSC